MTKNDLFEIIKSNVVSIIPDIPRDKIQIDKSLTELGANSIDRMEIVIKTLEDLKLKIPLVELGKVSNLQGLVTLLYEKILSA